VKLVTTAVGAAVALLVPVLLGACRSAHQVAGPQPVALPVIQEGFTHLPCPRGRAARTTIGAEGCLEKKILRTDAEINARARAIFRLLYDTTAKKRFRAGERAWLAYRKASCRSVADVYRGGTAGPVAFADCVVSRNRQHVTELAQFETLL
jgi:uncharacterized protein YecT (DUF1311 family)